jgi:acyl-coenzyme A thioesterase 7
MVQLVFPEDINPRDTLYGGRMMFWIATAGTLTASRCARGPVVLGAMDDLDFIHPVYLGEIVTVSSQVEYIGRTSLELGVEVHSENPRTGIRLRTTSSHLAFIALDEHEQPRPVGAVIAPASDAEAAVHAAAAARKAARSARARGAEGRGWPAGLLREDAGRSVRLSRLIMPEDALSGTLMFAGKLLAALDEVAAICAVRYCRPPIVTASLDTVYFTHPLRVGEIADISALLAYVGRSSMEIDLQVEGEEPRTGTRHHICTAFLTMVHLDDAGRPAPVQPFVPATPKGRRLWREADARRAQRKARMAHLRAGATPDG